MLRWDNATKNVNVYCTRLLIQHKDQYDIDYTCIKRDVQLIGLTFHSMNINKVVHKVNAI